MTATSVQLSWSGSTDAGGSNLAGYKVYRQKGTGASLPVGTVGTGTLSFVDQPLAPSTGYTYAIVAFDNAQNHSTPSSAVNVTTLANTTDSGAPAVPGNLQAQVFNRSSVHLGWAASTDAGGSGLAGYRVYRDGNPVSGASPITTPYFEETGLAYKTAYAYTVTAIDGMANTSAAAGPVTVTTGRQLVIQDNFNRADTSSGLGTNYLYGASGLPLGIWKVFFGTATMVPLNCTCWSHVLSASSGTSFKASITILSGPGKPGMTFWAEDSGPGYRAYLEGSYLKLEYFDNITANVQSGVLLASASYDANTMTVETDSSTRNIKVYLGGVLKINYTETNTSRPNSGAVGFHGLNGPLYPGDFNFDDFILER